jgi:N utilization substance protein A
MTQPELEQQIDRAVQGFCQIEGIDEELANRLVGEGYLSYDDLEVIEPDDLMEMGSLTAEQVDSIVEKAEVLAQEAEIKAAEEKRARRAAEQQAAAEAAQLAAAAAAQQAAASQATSSEPAESPAPAEPSEGAADSSAEQAAETPAAKNTDQA